MPRSLVTVRNDMASAIAPQPTATASPFPVRRTAVNPKPKKKLTRRVKDDRSQAIRRTYQLAFLILNVWLGGQFYLWVRHFEVGSAYVGRPAGVEGWLPIAGIMNLKYFVLTH